MVHFGNTGPDHIAALQMRIGNVVRPSYVRARLATAPGHLHHTLPQLVIGWALLES